jgi:integrase
MRGHVYQRGKSWTYVVDLPPDPSTGERRQKSKGGFRTEGEAEAACAEFITKLNKGLYVEDTSMTVADYLQLYLETHVEPNYKDTSYDVEQTIIEKRIIPAIGKVKLQQLTPIAITQFYTKLRKEYSSEYVKNIHATLRRALRQAYRWDILPTNIMDKVSTPKVEKKEMQFWTMEECQRFLQVAEGHVHYIIYALAIHTGMRRGEVLGLRWKDIDFERKTLTVLQTVNWTSNGVIIQTPKTKTSSRQIAVGDSLLKALRDRHKQVKENKLRHGKEYKNYDLVCCYDNGEPMKPKRITESFTLLTKRAGLKKIRFHDLRHSHASMLLKMGVNPKVGAERLGHSNVQIFLDRYSHLTESMQRDAVDLFESLMNEEKNEQKAVDK